MVSVLQEGLSVRRRGLTIAILSGCPIPHTEVPRSGEGGAPMLMPFGDSAMKNGCKRRGKEELAHHTQWRMEYCSRGRKWWTTKDWEGILWEMDKDTIFIVQRQDRYRQSRTVADNEAAELRGIKCLSPRSSEQHSLWLCHILAVIWDSLAHPATPQLPVLKNGDKGTNTSWQCGGN